MRARRLVTLLLLLQTGRTWAAAELARRLGASGRTVHRDILALREAGVPVQAARGPGGGFRLPTGYRSRVPLTEQEVAALLAGTPGAASALGLEALALDARLKLFGSLSAQARERVGWTADVVHVDEPAWFRTSDEPPVLRDIALAAAQRRRVEIEYRAGRGGVLVRRLDPLGLVLKAGVWYLVGRAGLDTRVYRVSRVRAVATTEEQFEPPPGFELASFWALARDSFERSRPSVAVTVRLHRAELPRLRRVVDWSVRSSIGEGRAVAGDTDRVDVALRFERLDYAYADLIKLAGDVEVRRPVELRERMIAAGRSLAAAYRVKACSSSS